MTWLLATIGTVLISLVVVEMFDWLDWLARRVVVGAAGRLPMRHRDRWRDEWLAELEVLPGKHLSHLLWAVGIWLRSPTLARALDRRPPLKAAIGKRTLDITVSSLCLVVFAPLLLLTASAIRLDSPGPVLLRQRRVGRGGRTFHILKFRTIVVAGSRPVTEVERGQITWDPRVTRLGRILRLLSLDELPAFINVLQGHMSIAGSSPLPEGLDQGDGAAGGYNGTRPGLTSWVSLADGGYISAAEARSRDHELATNWSLRGELRLLLATANAVMRQR